VKNLIVYEIRLLEEKDLKDLFFWKSGTPTSWPEPSEAP